MRRGLFAVALAAALTAGLSIPANADTAADTTILAGTCAGCHGAELGGSGAIPTLRGHSAEYIRFTLKAFQNGERQATVMNRLAAGYSDAEIDALAVYLSKLQ